MFVYVINFDNQPLMPCKPAKAKHLLKGEKAKVISRSPFTIKLLYQCEDNKQSVIGGIDTGSKVIGSAAITNGKVVYQAETYIRQDVSKKMKQRAMYRRTRRSRKCRYRPARWLNRGNSRRVNRLAPSIYSKINSHLREKRQIDSILPITEWRVETNSFDIHKITNPNVKGIDYQKGNQKGFYNAKSYVLNRDNYECQSGRKINHAKKLHVHHINFKSQDGSNDPNNLITLCEDCHFDLHAGKFILKAKKSKTKHATEIGIVKSQLKKLWNFTETFGYLTKYKRERVLSLPKTHFNDAVAICCEDDELVMPLNVILYKRHVASGDFKQSNGKRSEKRIPTGKLFGIRKFDLIKTNKGVGFVKGKRSSGFFALMDILNNTIITSVNIKKNCTRLSSRNTTLIGGWQSLPEAKDFRVSLL